MYAVAHNKLEEWRSFDRKDFGDFPDIALPINYAPTLDDLLKKAGLASNKASFSAPARPGSLPLGTPCNKAGNLTRPVLRGGG